MFDAALLSMPWPLFNRPSVQLGALKAYAERSGSGVRVRAMHPYLALASRLGTELYHRISQEMWLCEALYAGILFPERRVEIKKYLSRAGKSPTRKLLPDFDRVTGLLQEQLEALASSCDWGQFGLIGFSVCFNQTFASLAAARILKNRAPDVPIVFGGSACIADGAAAFMHAFQQIDYLAVGEGEQTFLDLCRYLDGKLDELPDSVRRRAGEDGDRRGGITGCRPRLNLSELPRPDYDDYMAEVRQRFAGEPFIPELPLEFSRGCWWGKCVFCSLNSQWQGYRFKTAAQVYDEVRALSARHGCLDFFFTDNALPVREALPFFARLAADDRDLRFFGEIRIGMGSEQLAACRRGGLLTVQAGIEALSTSLLRRMRKGTTAMENVLLIKECAALDIELKGNLITCFPGSTRREAEETGAALDFVMPFAPLSEAVFFLGNGSPVADDPERFGIAGVGPHPGYAALLPPGLLPELVFPVLGYRGDLEKQRRMWKPVRQKIRQWQEFHRGRRQKDGRHPALNMRDGGGFLLIRQELPGGKVLQHRLRGASREIYLCLGTVQRLAGLSRLFPAVSADRLGGFLDELVDKRLVFRENDRYLALAVRVRGGASIRQEETAGRTGGEARGSNVQQGGQ